jgi:tRNA threonylcarbamoyladenosine biosynthesis protein TsaB
MPRTQGELNMRSIVLSIESAIAGGSISLIGTDGVELAHWIGEGGVSKAEDLLADIDRLMRGHRIQRSDIGLIAVSAGPGSFTGIRVGIATALGLKNGLGVEMVSVSALEAMVFASGSTGHITAALPVGRGSVCLQEFKDGAVAGPPRVIAETELALVEGTVLDVNRIEGNLAYAIGLLANERPAVIEPMFISKGS